MKECIFFALLLITAAASHAQTGFFIYPDSVPGKPHVQIVDLKEGPDNDIYIAGEAKDEDFNLTSPWFLRTDLEGQRLDRQALAAEVTDIKRIIPVEKKQAMLYGNSTSEGGKSKPYTSLITERGSVSSVNVIAMSNAMILGDAIPFANGRTLVVQSNRDKTTRIYNLVLIKGTDDRYIPYGTACCASEYNEIASEAAVSGKKEIFIAGYRLVNEEIQPFIHALDSSGRKLWSIVPDISPGFLNVRISLDRKGNILLSAGYRDNTNGTCHSELWKSDASGKRLAKARMDDFKINGMLLLKDGRTMIFGADFQPYRNRIIISKGSFATIGDGLEILERDEMLPGDPPDVGLMPEAMLFHPTSSEFNAGIQLSDGRIVLGGRITYPQYTDPERIEGCDYYNQACLLFLDEKAKFRK